MKLSDSKIHFFRCKHFFEETCRSNLIASIMLFRLKLFISQIVWEHLLSRGNFVKKESHISRYVKGTQRSVPNVVGKFVTCTDDFNGGLKV